MRQSIQEWTKQNLWKTVFKKFEGVFKPLGIHLPPFSVTDAICFVLGKNDTGGA